MRGIFSVQSDLLLFVFAAVIHLSAGENDSLQVFQHDDIVITATRSEKHMSDVSRSMSVINSEDIANTVSLSPVEALSRQEGVFIIGNGQAPGALQNIYLRGVNTNSTVILVDGVRLTDPSSVDNSINLSELSLLNIDRIEMIRGSHSTLFGSSAIGGVINLITERNRQAGFNAEFYTQLGTFGEGTGLFNQNLLLNYTFLNGLYLSAEILNSDIHGFDATIDTVTNRTAFNKRDRDNFKKLDFMSRIGFTGDRIDAWLAYKSTDQKADIDQGAYMDDDNATIAFRRDLLSYAFSYRFNNAAELVFNGGLSDMRRTAVNDSSLVDASGNTDQTYVKGIYDGQTFTHSLQLNFTNENFSAVFGAEQYKETMSSYDYIYSNSIFGLFESETDLDDLDLETTTNNLYSHFDLNGTLLSRGLRNINLALGARYIDHSTFGRTFVYEINPSVKIPGGIIYGSIASGFNAPSLYRLYSPSANYISGITLGNRNLQPEKSTSLELGLRHTVVEDYTFSVAVFNTEIKDVHEYVYLWDSDIAVDTLGNNWLRDDFRGDTYINAGNMTIQGLELGFNSRLLGDILLSGNFSWIKGEQRFSPGDINESHTAGNHVQSFNSGFFITGDITSNGLARRANTAHLAIVYEGFSALSVGMYANYVGKREDVFYNAASGPYGSLATREVASFTVFDVTSSYDINRHIKASLRMENVLDTAYYEIRGYRSRGRSLYLGLRYTL